MEINSNWTNSTKSAIRIPFRNMDTNQVRVCKTATPVYLSSMLANVLKTYERNVIIIRLTFVRFIVMVNEIRRTTRDPASSNYCGFPKLNAKSWMFASPLVLCIHFTVDCWSSWTFLTRHSLIAIRQTEAFVRTYLSHNYPFHWRFLILHHTIMAMFG